MMPKTEQIDTANHLHWRIAAEAAFAMVIRQRTLTKLNPVIDENLSRDLDQCIRVVVHRAAGGEVRKIKDRPAREALEAWAEKASTTVARELNKRYGGNR